MPVAPENRIDISKLEEIRLRLNMSESLFANELGLAGTNSYITMIERGWAAETTYNAARYLELREKENNNNEHILYIKNSKCIYFSLGMLNTLVLDNKTYYLLPIT